MCRMAVYICTHTYVHMSRLLSHTCVPYIIVCSQHCVYMHVHIWIDCWYTHIWWCVHSTVFCHRHLREKHFLSRMCMVLCAHMDRLLVHTYGGVFTALCSTIGIPERNTFSLGCVWFYVHLIGTDCCYHIL